MPNDGDHINVSPGRLRETAGSFQKASQDTFDLAHDLTMTAHQLITEMYSQLHHSPTALENLCNRWSDSANSLGNALREVAHNLGTAADNYQNADQQGMPKN